MPDANEIIGYPISIFWSHEDEGYIATAKDLPGCSAWGKTRVEAIAEMEDAMMAWIEASDAMGRERPAPSGND